MNNIHTLWYMECVRWHLKSTSICRRHCVTRSRTIPPTDPGTSWSRVSWNTCPRIPFGLQFYLTTFLLNTKATFAINFLQPLATASNFLFHNLPCLAIPCNVMYTDYMPLHAIYNCFLVTFLSTLITLYFQTFTIFSSTLGQGMHL